MNRIFLMFILAVLIVAAAFSLGMPTSGSAAEPGMILAQGWSGEIPKLPAQPSTVQKKQIAPKAPQSQKSVMPSGGDKVKKVSPPKNQLEVPTKPPGWRFH